MSKIEIKIITNKEAFLLKEQMWVVYNHYFEFPKEKFYLRIKNTPYYALYKCKGDLIGFTGIYKDEMSLNNKKVLFLGLGSSIITPKYRGKYLLQKTCLKLRWNAFLKHPFQKVFFWCHASSYKTYCILAKFRTHYPAYNTSLPPKYKTIIDDIGLRVFGTNYNQSNGTAVYLGVSNKDKGNILTQKHLEDPVIRFFHQKIALSNIVEGGTNGLITIAPMDFYNVYNWFIDFVRGGKRQRI